MKNAAAVALGNKSWEKRRATQTSEYFKKLSALAAKKRKKSRRKAKNKNALDISSSVR